MSSFLKLAILITALYLFFRFFATFIAPRLIRLFIRRVQKKFYEQNPHVPNPDADIKPGKVTIHKTKDSKNNDIPKDLGEYIDFEDVKNNQKPTNE
ncbi:MAG TPA: hypothetical protein VK172_12210 [Lentimicrobium sp.]|nr:hypothetical protein [Lentimicrobium sp.]